MGKQAKPKTTKGIRSERPNGKAPKKNPKSNPVASKNAGSGGLSAAARERRAARRAPITLAGILGNPTNGKKS